MRRASCSTLRSGGETESAPQVSVSHRALTVARLIDRLCRAPGEYTITLTVPSHGRAPWEVQVSRVEGIRSMEIDRKGKST